MSKPLQLDFVLSADDIDRLPDSRAEVAVVGRSNVGKSSLINALGNRKALARVSKTPGRTQLLNCFELAGDDGATLVDCPGYGYAAVPARMRASWQRMIETYLLERDQLEMIIVLVDGEIGPTKLDVQLLDWLRASTRPHTVVATKHDKVKSTQRDKRKRELAAACNLEPSDVVWVSATKGTGIDRLRDLVRLWLGRS
ncbi:MAG: GTP-binding protein [Actinomycetota bacterium]